MDLRPDRNIRPFPSIDRPKIVGAFSLNSQRQYVDSLEQLKYLKIPDKIDFDLNLGDDTYQEKVVDPADEKLKHLLNFMMKNIKNISRPDFVCFRGLLRLISCTPYEYREPWTILATRYKGTIFLWYDESPLEKEKRMNRSAEEKKLLHYGYKFENFLFANHPTKFPPAATEPVIESEEFSIMFESKIAGKKILYGAEVDGVISNEEINSLDELRNCNLAEVKVKRRESNENQLKNFYKFKARKWWLQSFFAGINTIHYGIRNDDGIVEEIKSVKLKELSDLARDENYWHGTVAVNFLNDFLTKVTIDMKNIDNPNTVYRYEYDTKYSNFVTYQKYEGQRFRFLDDNFVIFMENL